MDLQAIPQSPYTIFHQRAGKMNSAPFFGGPDRRLERTSQTEFYKSPGTSYCSLQQMALILDNIVPWGRSRREYELMFNLVNGDRLSRVLDCGGGPASFTAEMATAGHSTVSVDPLYAYSGPEIRARFELTVDPVLAQIQATPDDWSWGYHRDPEALLNNRRSALETFLADYETGLGQGRYILGALPMLPFASGSFDLALCSHLLFLYSDLLSEAFHIQAVRELCRVAGEIRIFPITTLRLGLSPHLPAVGAALDAKAWRSEIVRVNYELQRGANEMLRVFRP